MALSKVNYVDNQTIITAQNLNNIQNEIIQNTELIKKAAPRNILDNSDFRHPVNQRGITVSNVFGYGLDRWIHVDKSFSGTVSITTDANGTTFNTSDGTDVGLIQRFIDKNYYDGEYTAAIKTGDGSILIGGVMTENAEAHMKQAVFWFPTGTTVVWAALYEGAYTAETLPEYHPKGYAVELAECRRYYLNGVFAVTIGSQYGASRSIFSICTDEMRIMPSVTITNAIAQGWGDVNKSDYNQGWGDRIGSKLYYNFVNEKHGQDAGKTIVVRATFSADL